MRASATTLFALLLTMLVAANVRADDAPDFKVELVAHEVALPTRSQLAPLEQVAALETGAETKLLMFRRIDETLLAKVRALSKEARVIVVATTPGSYGSAGDASTRAGKARLLNAGAEAALSWGTPEQIGERLRGALLYAHGGAPANASKAASDAETQETLELADAKKRFRWTQRHPTYREKIEALKKAINTLEGGSIDLLTVTGMWGNWQLKEATRHATELGDKDNFWLRDVSSDLDFVTPELEALRARYLAAKRKALASYHKTLEKLLAKEQIGDAPKVIESLLAFGKADARLEASAKRIAARTTRRLEAFWRGDRPGSTGGEVAVLTPAAAETAKQGLAKALDRALQVQFERLADEKGGAFGSSFRRPVITKTGAVTATGKRRVALEVREGRSSYTDPMFLLKEEIPRFVAFADVHVDASGRVDIVSLDLPRSPLGSEKLATQRRPYWGNRDDDAYADNGSAAFYRPRSKPDAVRHRAQWLQAFAKNAAPAPQPAHESGVPLYLLGPRAAKVLGNQRMLRLAQEGSTATPMPRNARFGSLANVPAYPAGRASNNKTGPPPAPAPMTRMRMLTR